MGLFRQSGSKTQRLSEPAETSLRLLIDGISAELHANRLELKRMNDQLLALRKDVVALNGFRLALEAKTWEAFHRRRVGRVKAGVARATSASRDARGRFL